METLLNTTSLKASAIFSILSITIAIIVKIIEQIRLSRTEKIEIDIKLVTYFSELMNLAHARPKPGDTIIGSASQDAAIAGLFLLGKNHKVLYPLVAQGLASLAMYNIKREVSLNALKQLNKYYNGKIMALTPREYFKEFLLSTPSWDKKSNKIKD